MVKVQRAESFLGCCALLFGVEIVCLLHLISNIFVISISSSQVPIELMGVTVSPTIQAMNAAWALGGVPVIIGAGVGAVYRIESHLRLYYWYMVLTMVLNTFWLLSLIFSGSICQSVVSADVQRMGSAFVCGFTDTFVFFWILIGGVVGIYFIYVVWSAADEISSASYPELLKYRAILRGAATAVPAAGAGGYGADAMGGPKGFAAGPPSGYAYGSMPGQFASAPGGQGMYSQGMVGTPQSFVPQPGVGAARSY